MPASFRELHQEIKSLTQNLGIGDIPSQDEISRIITSVRQIINNLDTLQELLPGQSSTGELYSILENLEMFLQDDSITEYRILPKITELRNFCSEIDYKIYEVEQRKLENIVIDTSDQNWLIAPMIKEGYLSSSNGLCFGFAHKGMHAFFADDLKKFDKRNAELANYALQDGADLEPLSVDIRAFLDGVYMMQSDDAFVSQFKMKLLSQYQNASRAQELVLPVQLQEDPPISLEQFLHTFNKENFKDYLELLQNQENPTTFSVIMSCDRHAVNLNYDPKLQKWFFINAGNRITYEFTDLNILTDEIFSSFNCEKTITFSANLFTQQSLSQQQKHNLSSLKQTSKYREIRINSINQFSNTNSNVLLSYAVLNNNTKWLFRNLTHFDLNQEQLDDLLELAVFNSDIITVKCLYEKGAKFKDSGLDHLICKYQQEILLKTKQPDYYGPSDPIHSLRSRVSNPEVVLRGLLNFLDVSPDEECSHKDISDILERTLSDIQELSVTNGNNRSRGIDKNVLREELRILKSQFNKNNSEDDNSEDDNRSHVP